MLSKADEKLLNRLQIPPAQKILIEDYWQANPAKKSVSRITNAGLSLLRPAMIAALASPYFASGTKPIVNIALVLLWMLILAGTMINIIIVGMIATYSQQGKDEIMGRPFISFLPGAQSRWKRTYSGLSWAALFGLTASEGYFITGAMIAVGWGFGWVLDQISGEGVKKFLEARAAETPIDRIVRTITLRSE